LGEYPHGKQDRRRDLPLHRRFCRDVKYQFEELPSGRKPPPVQPRADLLTASTSPLTPVSATSSTAPPSVSNNIAEGFVATTHELTFLAIARGEVVEG
jgi:hypothetical protein